MNKWIAVALLGLTVACGGDDKKKDDGEDPGLREGDACTQAGTTQCSSDNFVLVCDGTEWQNSQDCGAGTCGESSAAAGVYICIASATAAEFERCDATAPCGDGLTCGALQGTTFAWCLQDCGADAGVCGNGFYCDTNQIFGGSHCLQASDRGEMCFSDDACVGTEETCVLLDGINPTCRRTCDGANLGTTTGCDGGESCLPGPGLEVQGGADNAVTCTGPEDTACDTGGNYKCLEVFRNGSTTPELLCVRPLAYCGQEAPVLTQTDSTTLGDLADPDNFDDNCELPSGSSFCPAFDDVTALSSCEAVGFAWPIQLASGPASCETDDDCYAVSDANGVATQCANFGGQLGQVCAIFNKGCVLICEPEEAGGDDRTCPTGTSCQVPTGDNQSVGNSSIQGGGTACTGGDTCADDATCQDVGGQGNFCVKSCAVAGDCAEGYECGFGTLDICSRGLKLCLDDDGTVCTEADLNACGGNGTCNEAANGGLGECTCDTGFSGTQCEACATGFTGAACDACDTGFFGADCASCACPSNSTCDEGIGGTGCECDEGFYGAACDQTCACGTNEVCNDGVAGDGACECAEGFYGESCDMACACGVNEVCDDGRIGSGTCECADGVYGASCDMQCACGLNEVCNDGTAGDGSCECLAGFYGNACDMECGCENGDCNDGKAGDGACSCDAGWMGTLCDACDADFYGETCLACPSTGNGTCDNHGTCADGLAGDGSCTCDAGFDAAADCADCVEDVYGAACDQNCPSDGSGVCGGNGTCGDGVGGDGSCTCNGNFDPGADCTDCAPDFFGAACAGTCPSTGNGTCDGQGTCDDGIAGDGTCTCTGNFDAALDCAECMPDFWGADCSNACACTALQTCDDGIAGTGACN